MVNLDTTMVTPKLNGAAKDFEKSVKDRVRVTNQALEQISHHAGEKAEKMATQLSKSIRDYFKMGRHFVKQNPVKSVAIVAAVGLVIGGLISMAAGKAKVSLE